MATSLVAITLSCVDFAPRSRACSKARLTNTPARPHPLCGVDDHTTNARDVPLNRQIEVAVGRIIGFVGERPRRECVLVFHPCQLRNRQRPAKTRARELVQRVGVGNPADDDRTIASGSRT